MASGTDVAIEAAGITLMRGDPALVADAIDISRRTYRKIQQNLFWAFVYNLIGIPLAAFGLLNVDRRRTSSQAALDALQRRLDVRIALRFDSHGAEHQPQAGIRHPVVATKDVGPLETDAVRGGQTFQLVAHVRLMLHSTHQAERGAAACVEYRTAGNGGDAPAPGRTGWR